MKRGGGETGKIPLLKVKGKNSCVQAFPFPVTSPPLPPVNILLNKDTFPLYIHRSVHLIAATMYVGVVRRKLQTQLNFLMVIKGKDKINKYA